MKMFNRMHWQVDGMNAKVQPVFANDVATAILNCLKIEESIGQTYDLGGPHVYTYEEIYRMLFNITLIKPYTTVVKLEDVYELYHYKWWQSFYRQMFRTWLSPEFFLQESVDLVCNPANKGFEDLHIKPVSFGQKAHEHVNEIYWLYNSHEESMRDRMNS